MIHGNKYKRLSDYISMNDEIKLLCAEHGEFKQICRSHLNGFGCKKCSNNEIKSIKFLNEIIGNKGKCLDSIFTGMRFKYNCKCNCGHEWKITGNKIQQGQWCRKCAGSFPKNLNWLNEIANKKGGKCISVEYFGSHRKYKWECDKGHQWEATASHINKDTWCPKCRESKGELAIKKFLIENKIKYEQQKIFEKCKGKRRALPFDFWIPELRTIIEFNGIQHYKQPTGTWNKNFDLTRRKELDQIKIEFCKNNNINFIEISYLEINKVSEILKKLKGD